MSDIRIDNNLGSLLKQVLNERSLSMRKLSQITGIDTATISRIINGKRKANPEHLQKFADCLGIPVNKLFVAAGFAIELEREKQYSDIHTSVESIQKILESSDLYDKKFTITDVEQQLANYEKYAQTKEGKELILVNFEEKLQNVAGIGPFVSKLKDMHERFILKNGTPYELALMGAALIYFISPIDVIPDFLFPIGYLDDAIAIQLVASLLLKNSEIQKKKRTF